MAFSQAHIKNELDDDGLIDDEENDTYRPRPQLPKPFVVMRSLRHLMNGLENGTIDVDPEYQREVVWTADRMTGLVDSSMENFYIPPIILNKKPRSTGDGGAPSDTLVCVDGKQRLSSVRAFIRGIIPCHDHLGEKWWFGDEQLSSRHKRILSEQTQMQFLAKEFVSFEFTSLSPEQEEDLFARVQMGIQLSVAEKMWAQSGPWQELARLFVDDFPSIYSLMNDRARAKDFQLTLSCFSQILEVMHPTASNGIPALKTIHSQLSKLLSNKNALDDGLKSHLASVWNILKDLIDEDSDTFTNKRKTLTGVQTFAPIEMVAVTVIISMYSKTRNNQLLLGDIQVLRETLREHYVDLRLNAITWKFVWDFIENLEAVRGAVDGSTAQRNRSSIPIPGTSLATFATSKRPSVPSAKKSRPVAKPNPSNVHPTQTPITAMREDASSVILSRVHPAKRRRINPQPTNGEASATSSVLIEDGLSDTSWKQPTGKNQTKRSSASIPTQVVPEARSSTLIILSDSSPSATALVTRSPYNQPTGYRSSPYVPASTTQRSTPERKKVAMTPGEARRRRISELNSYRAQTLPRDSRASPASIASPSFAPTAAMRSTVSSFPMWPKPATTAPTVPQSQATLRSVSASSPISNGRKSNKGSPKTWTALGAFAPKHVDAQWEGTTTSLSPKEQPRPFSSVHQTPVGPISRSASRAVSKAGPARRNTQAGPSLPLSVERARITPKAKTRPSRPTLPQYDGAIDLTSGTEEERQNLLTAFKSRSPASMQGHGGTKPEPQEAQVERR